MSTLACTTGRVRAIYRVCQAFCFLISALAELDFYVATSSPRCYVVPGFYVRVSAPTLFMSLLILFAMIALVIGTIIINKWQLSKPLGATM